MNILLFLCGWLGFFEKQASWISRLPLLAQPVPLYPQNMPFFTFYELRSIEKDIFDLRPDAIQTDYNFSIYSSPKQPISSLRTTIEDRLYASLPSFETLPDTLPHATFQPNDFSPIPWPHPPLASYAKTREEASSSFFPTDSSAYSQTGSTGLSSRIFDGKEN